MKTLQELVFWLLTGGEGPIFNLGVIIGLSLLGLLWLVLPRGRRAAVRFPLLCLIASTICTTGHLLAMRSEMYGALGFPLSLVAMFFLLIALGRALFLLTVNAVTLRGVASFPKIFLDILQGLIYAGALLFVLQAAGVQLGSLLVTSALLTAVLGFALQETLGNLVAGLTLQAQQPFDVGDWIQLDDHVPIGEVIEVNWRATKAITLDHVEVTIPNGVLAKNSILNYSKPKRAVRRSVYVLAPYRIPPFTVQEAVLKALSETPDVLKTPAPSVVTNRFLETGMTEYWVRYFIEAFERRDGIDGGARDRIWYALERAAVEHPYGTSTIQLRRLDGDHIDEQRKTEIDEAVGRLRSVPFLDPLSNEELAHMAAKLRRKLYATGETIIRQGDEGDEFFILDQGEVAVLIDGHEVKRMQSGAFFGEMSLLTGEPRSATITSVGQVMAFVVKRDTFREVLMGNPELAQELCRALAERQVELDHVQQSKEITEKIVAEKSSQFLSMLRRFFSLK